MAELLEPLRRHPGRTAVLSDFDGTLAAVVDDPASAVPLDGVADVLAVLSGRYAAVVVVSGRPASYLVGRLGGAPVDAGLRLSGLYGLEHADGHGGVVLAEEAAPWAAVAADAATRARAELGDVVEDKGASLTLHFRTAPDREAEILSWAREEADRSGLVVRPAKASVELHPPVGADKGSVVDAAVAHLGAACFLGDDVGDVPAFDALDRFAAAGGHAVRIGVRSAEAPTALLERADLVVDGPEGALDVLRALAAD